jgi:hypothetical protein
MRCPSCSFEDTSGIKFCGECGAPLKLKCSDCGFENAAGIKFCGECGKPLVGAAKLGSLPDPRRRMLLQQKTAGEDYIEYLRANPAGATALHNDSRRTRS